jgi:short-subunit dehydrogenase involved in D-alanine esterification of teichoic acids
MPFPHKTVLLIGATSGIGAALADKLITEGTHVIAVGRRQSRLDAFVAKHGPQNATGLRFDITNSAGMDAFVASVFSSHPTLSCVILNSGIQSPILLSRPEKVDMAAFHHEIHVNFTCLVNLAMKVLPRLQEKGEKTALVFTGTFLSLVPAVVLPAYSISKTALSVFVECLRAQNRHKNSTKIIEVLAPVVQSMYYFSSQHISLHE